MSYIQQQEEANHIVATDTDLDRADARQSGQEHPERAWVLTDRDVWHANPFYKGPAVPHPEDCPYAEDEDDGEDLADSEERLNLLENGFLDTTPDDIPL